MPNVTTTARVACCLPCKHLHISDFHYAAFDTILTVPPFTEGTHAAGWKGSAYDDGDWRLDNITDGATPVAPDPSSPWLGDFVLYNYCPVWYPPAGVYMYEAGTIAWWEMSTSAAIFRHPDGWNLTINATAISQTLWAGVKLGAATPAGVYDMIDPGAETPGTHDFPSHLYYSPTDLPLHVVGAGYVDQITLECVPAMMLSARPPDLNTCPNRVRDCCGKPWVCALDGESCTTGRCPLRGVISLPST